jgi:hypothetical protein
MLRGKFAIQNIDSYKADSVHLHSIDSSPKPESGGAQHILPHIGP